MEENINELIYLYHMQDEEALRRLISCYRPLVRCLFHRQPRDIEKADYLSFADALLVECLDNYRTDLSMTFSTYYRTCLKNRSIDEAQKRKRLHPDPGTLVLSLDDTAVRGGSRTLQESLPDVRHDLERQVHARMVLEEVVRNCRLQGDPAALRILQLRLQEYSLREISELTGVSYARVRYLLDKIRRETHKKIDSQSQEKVS